MWTDRTIKAFPARERRYYVTEDTHQRGVGRLMLDIQPSGAKTFYFQYHSRGVRRRLKIGRYRDSTLVAGITLSQAREQAAEYGCLLVEGVDPQTRRAEARAKAEATRRELEIAARQGTLGQLLDAYLAAMEAGGRRSVGSVARSLKAYVRGPFPHLAGKPAREITAEDITQILRAMIAKGVTTHSNRVRSYLSAAFNYGITLRHNPRAIEVGEAVFHINANPVAAVPRQEDFERIGNRVLTEAEIGQVWADLDEYMPIIPATAVRLALATGQRTGELLRTPRECFDLIGAQMTIPAGVSKNSRDHVVPLPPLALALVRDLLEHTPGCRYPFAAQKRQKGAGHVLDPDKPLPITSLDKRLREDYLKTAHPEIPMFTNRDLRRTVKTLMGKAGIDKAVRDRIQNHALHDVSSRHYDRYEYAREKRAGLDTWCMYLERIINPASNVVPLSETRPA